MDENHHMCSQCEAKEAADFKELIESGKPLPRRLSLKDWENK